MFNRYSFSFCRLLSFDSFFFALYLYLDSAPGETPSMRESGHGQPQQEPQNNSHKNNELQQKQQQQHPRNKRLFVYLDSALGETPSMRESGRGPGKELEKGTCDGG